MATPTTLPATFVAGNVLTAAQMNNLRGAFRILQVVSAAKIDTFSTSSTSLVDVTGLSVTLTPSSTSSQVLVIAQLNGGMNNISNAGVAFRLVGGNSANYVPAAAGSRTRSQFQLRYRTTNWEEGFWSQKSGSIMYLDSPATTSATTYKIQMSVTTGTVVGYVNRQGDDADVSEVFRQASSITAFEVSA